MEKMKWSWKRKSSERSSGGESESSGSVNSHSERYSDEQAEVNKASPNHYVESPEVTSKSEEFNNEDVNGSLKSNEDVNGSLKNNENANGSIKNNEEVNGSVKNTEDVNGSLKNMTERLSAALVNVSAKDDLVKQHVKVAEEAVAGWEKAENEMAMMKLKLEAAVKQNTMMEDRVSHLDGALKECVRQLRQARDDQERKICEAVNKKTLELQSIKTELESQLKSVRSEHLASSHVDLKQKLDFLERENSALKVELESQSEELEIRTIERDLSTQAAETASKQQLESIKKVAKLEAECRRLKVLLSKSSSVNDQRSNAASSMYVESLSDSQSDSGDRLNAVEPRSFSDSWASALIVELDQFKNEKTVNRNISNPNMEIDLMGDFLEMERLASLPEREKENQESESISDVNESLRAELDVMINRTAELETKLEKMEAEKTELESQVKQSKNTEDSLKSELEAVIHQTTNLREKLELLESEKHELKVALNESRDKSEAAEVRLREVEMNMKELQEKLHREIETKQSLEANLVGVEAEARAMSTKVYSLEAEVRKERALSAQVKVKCQELEEELYRKKQEAELQLIVTSNREAKIKQEDLAVAAGKLADCQKTIASLGKQLQSLATLEDFLIDTGSIPGLSSGEQWKLNSNEMFLPRNTDMKMVNSESSVALINASSPQSSPSVSSNNGSSDKNRNGFAKFFTRSKNGIQLEI